MVGWQTPLISNLFLLWHLSAPAFLIFQLLSIMGACLTSTFLSVPLCWTILYPRCQCMTFVVAVVIDICFVVFFPTIFPDILKYYRTSCIIWFKYNMFVSNKGSTSWSVNSFPFRDIDENLTDMAKCTVYLCVNIFKPRWWRTTIRFGSPGGKIFLVAVTVSHMMSSWKMYFCWFC